MTDLFQSHSTHAVFTQQQIQFIEQIVDQRLQLQKPARVRAAKDYHSTDEIRELIYQYLPDFREWVGSEEFPVNVLRHFLRRKVTLRARDTEMLSTGSNHASIERFDQQIGNAIQPAAWPNSPFVSGSRAGRYKLRDAEPFS